MSSVSFLFALRLVAVVWLAAGCVPTDRAGLPTRGRPIATSLRVCEKLVTVSPAIQQQQPALIRALGWSLLPSPEMVRARCMDDLRVALEALAKRRAPENEWPLEATVRDRLHAFEGAQNSVEADSPARQAEGVRLVRLLAAQAALPYAVTLAGLAILLGWAIQRERHPPTLAGASVVAPWGIGQGLRLCVVSALAGGALYVAADVCAGVFGVRASGFAWVAFVPMLVLLRRRLREHGSDIVRHLGLDVRGRVGATVIASIALIGVEESVRMAAAVLTAGSRGLSATWSRDDLVVDSTGVLLRAAFDTVVVAPVFEEMAFRGILYPTLRTRLSTWPAVLIVAAAFSGLHLFQPVGAAVTFVVGIASTAFYERTRCLWPCVMAHAFHNLRVIAYLVLTYR